VIPAVDCMMHSDANYSTYSRDSHNSIKANLKAAQGDLYFLEKALLFLVKPTTFIEYDSISSVVFSR